MTRNILQILSIILFFFLIGYVLTFPYELSYQGNDEIVLLEDSYEKTSLEELINRKEFKGKALYIKIWEPFDTEFKPYTDKELKTFKNQLDSLKDNPDSDEYKRLSMKLKGRMVQRVSTEEQLYALKIVSNKYKNSNVAFVYITDPDNDSSDKKDDFRKWKMAVKEYKIAGYHLIMNPKLVEQVRQTVNEFTNNQFFPFYLLADKQGNVANYQASWPQDTTLLYSQIDSLLVN